MCDGSKEQGTGYEPDEPEGRTARIRRRFREWQIRQQIVRGMAYGVGSGAVSLIVLWAQTR